MLSVQQMRPFVRKQRFHLCGSGQLEPLEEQIASLSLIHLLSSLQPGSLSACNLHLPWPLLLFSWPTFFSLLPLWILPFLLPPKRILSFLDPFAGFSTICTSTGLEYLTGTYNTERSWPILKGVLWLPFCFQVFLKVGFDPQSFKRLGNRITCCHMSLPVPQDYVLSLCCRGKAFFDGGIHTLPGNVCIYYPLDPDLNSFIYPRIWLLNALCCSLFVF